MPQDVIGGNVCGFQKEQTRELRRSSLTPSMSVSFELLNSLARQTKDNINLSTLLSNFHRTVTKSVQLKFRFIKDAN